MRLFILFTGMSIALSVTAQYAWKPAALKMDSVPVCPVRDISISGKHVWVIPGSDLQQKPVRRFSKSVDGGVTWASGRINIPDTFANLSIFGFNKDIAWLTVTGITSFSSRVYRTDDGGKTWNWQQTAVLDGPAMFLHFYDKDNGLVSDGRSLFGTTDGGNNWDLLSAFSNIGPLFSDAYDVKGNNIWIGDAFGNVLISNNKGKSWHLSSQPLTDNSMKFFAVKGIAFADENNGLLIGLKLDSFASDDNIFFRTGDGGENWQKVTFKGQGSVFGGSKFDIANIPQTKSYVITSGLGSAITRNSGNSWQALSANSYSVVEFLDSTVGFAGGFISNNDNGIFLWHNSLLSVDHPLIADDFYIYPNPAAGLVHIQNPAGEAVQIFNTTGSLVFSFTATQTGTEVMTADWPRGLYMVKSGSRNYRLVLN